MGAGLGGGGGAEERRGEGRTLLSTAQAPSPACLREGWFPPAERKEAVASAALKRRELCKSKPQGKALRLRGWRRGIPWGEGKQMSGKPGVRQEDGVLFRLY